MRTPLTCRSLQAFVVIEMIMDVLFWVDIVLHFRTAQLNSRCNAQNACTHTIARGRASLMCIHLSDSIVGCTVCSASLSYPRPCSPRLHASTRAHQLKNTLCVPLLGSRSYELIWEPEEIARRYKKSGWFYVDMFASFPLDYLAFFGQFSGYRGVLQVGAAACTCTHSMALNDCSQHHIAIAIAYLHAQPLSR